MSTFARRVAMLTGVEQDGLERLSGGALSEALLVTRPDGRRTVAKHAAPPGVEAAMLRALLDAGLPAPLVEGEHDGMLLLEYIANDRLFSPRAWASVGAGLRGLHARTADRYGWPSDTRIGTVEIDNRQGTDWPAFWGGQRLVATAALLDRPWRERVDALAGRLTGLLPAAPTPSHLHGDLWTGNILVADGRLAALIDPACYHGDREVDLAMLTLFDAPPPAFWEAYGPLASGWEARRPIYQLFPALLHLRLFGAAYADLVDRLLGEAGA